MIQLYTDTGQRIGVLAGHRELHVKHTLEYDEKILYFKYPKSGPYVEQLKNEAYVRTKKDEFVIKLVTGTTASDWISVTATMNIEGIENCLFVGGFEAVEMTVDAVLALALEDSDWTVGTCEITKKRTIRKEDDCDAWAILQQCVRTYRCEIEIDTLGHVINIYETRGENRGVHFMEGVNLKRLEYDRDTYEFFTQIVPVGKNGMTLLSDTDDPVLILEDYTYSKKKVRKIWRDERYTNAKSLREDAMAKLAEACKPISSYTGSVKDLAAGNTEHPDFFSYGIGDTIILVSKSTGIREWQRVVEINEYEHDQDNQVEINNVSKSFAQMQRDEQEVATETAARLANGYTDTQLEDYMTTDEAEQTVAEVTTAQLAGYATKGELTNIASYAESLAQDAQETADEAREDATDALALAAAAMDTAEVAWQTSQQALAAVNAALDKETGQAATDENGAVTVALTEEFAAAAAGKYRVWLQALGAGEVYVSESDTEGFTVTGPAGLTFNWLAIRYTETIDDVGEETTI